MHEQVRFFMLVLLSASVAFLCWLRYRKLRQKIRQAADPAAGVLQVYPFDHTTPLTSGTEWQYGITDPVSHERLAELAETGNTVPARCPAGHYANRGAIIAGKRHIVLLPVVLGCLMTACRKESVPVSELLTAHTWLTADVQVYGAGYNGETAIEVCSLDNTIRFNNNNTVLFDYGTVQCDPGETRLHLVQWSLSEDGRLLVMGGQQYELAVINRDYLRFYLRNYPINTAGEKADIYFRYVRE